MTTLESILFGDHRDALRRIERSIASAGVAIHGLGPNLVISGSEVARAVVAALDTPVGALAEEAWCQYDEVEQARRRTAGRRGARESVRLLRHTVNSTQPLRVEVDSGGVRQTITTLTLRVSVSVNAVTLVVEAGKVTRVVPGAASAEASLALGDVVVAHGSLKDVTVTSVDADPARGRVRRVVAQRRRVPDLPPLVR